MKPYITKIRTGIYGPAGNRNYRCTIPKKLIKDGFLERNIIFWINKKKQIVITPASENLEHVNGISINSHVQSNGHSYYIIFPDRVLASYISRNNLKTGRDRHAILNKDSFKIISQNNDFILF